METIVWYSYGRREKKESLYSNFKAPHHCGCELEVLITRVPIWTKLTPV